MVKTCATAEELTLRKNVSRFFSSRARLRAPLLSALKRIKQKRITAYIFGGALRDLMVKGWSAEPRDIDIVVDSPLSTIESMFADYLVRRTRFGGLHLNVRGWAVDVWPLSETWALRESLVDHKDFQALCKTTFLNVEAVAAEITTSRRLGTRVYSHGFFEGIQSRTLDINLEENPFPELCTVRALITASSLQFALSRRLAEYLLYYLRRTSFEELMSIQLSHYGFVRCNLETLIEWQNRIETQMHVAESITPLTNNAAQLRLWCECTPSSSLGCHSRCVDSRSRDLCREDFLPDDCRA